jgi:adenylate kinase
LFPDSIITAEFDTRGSSPSSSSNDSGVLAMRLIMLGPPGAGKGTQSQLLVQHLKIPHLSTGEMLRAAIAQGTAIGLHAKRYIDQGQLVPDDTVLQLVSQRLEQPDAQTGWLLDGFPRRVSQAEALDEMLARRQTPIDGVIDLHVDENELIERMVARGRSDDKPEVIRERMATYHRQTTPLTDYYAERQLLESVEAMGTVEDVFSRLLEAVGRLETHQR